MVGNKNSLADQIWQISYPSGEARQINSDSSNYHNLSLTAQENFLIAIRKETEAHIWTMPAGDANAARRLTTGFEKSDGVDGMGRLPDDKIFYNSISSGKETIWISRADGSQSRQVAKGTGIVSASPDGRRLVYQRIVSKNDIGLWSLNLNDGAEEKITPGVDIHPAFSPDGKWMVFTRYGDRQVALLKVPSGGGEPTMIYNEFLIGPAISPDDKTIAVEHRTISLINFESGALIKKFKAKPERSDISNLKKLQWTADGKGIYFISRASGASNIWRQPVDDSSAPVQVTDFKDGKIFNFAFSLDESQIVLSRGTFNSDVVLIENAE